MSDSRIPYPQRFPLARLPTPIQPLERLGDRLNLNFFIKRDDLTGLVSSGNKIRKLEFLFREAVDRGSDIVVTCGALQSNHARATAAAAAKSGLQCLLILRGDPSAAPEGNFFLDRLLGADIFFVTPEEYRDIDIVFGSVEQRLRAKGRRPYAIPEGGSNPLGCFGYVAAMEEIHHQARSQDLNLDSIFCAVGSGGTYAGLILGKKLLRMDIAVYGIIVGETAEYFRDRILQITQGAIERFRLPISVGADEIRLIDGYVGDGYGKSRPEELAAIRDLARSEGIVLDPVYTGKAMFGLLDRLGKEPGCFGRNVLFLHTGGLFGLFSHAHTTTLTSLPGT